MKETIAKPKKKICCACPETKRPRDEVRLQPRERARARALTRTRAPALGAQDARSVGGDEAAAATWR